MAEGGPGAGAGMQLSEGAGGEAGEGGERDGEGGTGAGEGGREEEDEGPGVCARCWEENRRLALWRLDWLCAAIPGMFVLVPEAGAAAGVGAGAGFGRV
ncbi:hypothetical protein DFH11DRAFT_1590219 [Phellopilus nigrolimitatus]|nr:hypothetical protein DFH11DRAFT_1590219 [Phellopilus nigrolimitatus]